jgi:hypothetical protein
MREFIARYQEKIAGSLSGFDRLVFRGSLRTIAYLEGMGRYLQRSGVLLKDFGQHVERVTGQLKKAALAEAQREHRPIEYLTSSQVSKEDLARSIADRDGVESGLICTFKCVEPCRTFDIHRNAEDRKLELVSRQRKCLFLYNYRIHPLFGFMSARIQTWFPFPIQICINGREWLGRQMDRAGIDYVAAGNCFPWVERLDEAQQLLDEQLRTDWPSVLGGIADELNPIHSEIFQSHPVPYYWTTYQSEWATDVIFHHAADLTRLYPRLLHHGIKCLGSSDVMRYLGKRVRLDGRVQNKFVGEIVTTLNERQEGIRIKHNVNGNSVKMYNKALTNYGSVLRAETTIQNGSDLRVYRAAERDPKGPKSWRRLRRGIADLHRRADLSRKACERYLDAFSTVDDDTTLEELIARSHKHTTWRGRRVRALRPFDQDQPLLAALVRGEFAITGLRNRDFQRLLFTSPPNSPKEARRRSAWVSRQLRLLRAHGLIKKINGSHRYLPPSPAASSSPPFLPPSTQLSPNSAPSPHENLRARRRIYELVVQR